MRTIVLDLETKKIFDEVEGGKHSLLGVSVAGVWDSTDNQLKAFFENELPKLWPVLEAAQLIIGFNIKKFDWPVLEPYYPGNIKNLPTLDLLEIVKDKAGFRLRLDDLAVATLGRRKSGHGLQAVKFYKEGRLEELAAYCLDDVVITRDLYHYALKNGHLKYYDLGKVLKTFEVDLTAILPKKDKVDTQMSLGV